jgi:hypothetical protein
MNTVGDSRSSRDKFRLRKAYDARDTSQQSDRHRAERMPHLLVTGERLLDVGAHEEEVQLDVIRHIGRPLGAIPFLDVQRVFHLVLDPVHSSLLRLAHLVVPNIGCLHRASGFSIPSLMTLVKSGSLILLIQCGKKGFDWPKLGRWHSSLTRPLLWCRTLDACT